ncbi:hypothetical protein SAMN06297164_1494 [Nitrosomonas ureae]|uniref:Uncharacterized protein n=1 Tax=Nitrosomonas ureae TaxID=44577 RepID=A0A286A8D4_9PROT|nr:hypothetical protein SAMN06297164_1494 [Nitrosomonas ureae]
MENIILLFLWKITFCFLKENIGIFFLFLSFMQDLYQQITPLFSFHTPEGIIAQASTPWLNFNHNGWSILDRFNSFIESAK